MVGSQIFVFVVIFAAMGLLAGERERGTLSWVASKPVSRTSIWASKFASGTAVLFVTAAILPMIVTTAVVVALYGEPSLGAVALITLGMGAAIALFVAGALTASTFVAGQPGFAASRSRSASCRRSCWASCPRPRPTCRHRSSTGSSASHRGRCRVRDANRVAGLAVALGATSARRMGQLDL